MRCKNPECLRTMRSPSDKTKETGFCGDCRKTKEIQDEIRQKMVIKIKPKGRRKAKFTAIEKFEESLKNNPEYNKFINMFRDSEKISVKSM